MNTASDTVSLTEEDNQVYQNLKISSDELPRRPNFVLPDLSAPLPQIQQRKESSSMFWFAFIALGLIIVFLLFSSNEPSEIQFTPSPEYTLESIPTDDLHEAFDAKIAEAEINRRVKASLIPHPVSSQFPSLRFD